MENPGLTDQDDETPAGVFDRSQQVSIDGVYSLIVLERRRSFHVGLARLQDRSTVPAPYCLVSDLLKAERAGFHERTREVRESAPSGCGRIRVPRSLACRAGRAALKMC
jgi:hypothetical protein